MSYIFDTNILMSDIDVSDYKDSTVYIPIIVLEELDKNNHSLNSEVSYKAREGLRKIKSLNNFGNLEYITLKTEDFKNSEISDILTNNINDNLILFYSKYIQSQKDNKAILITKDYNLYQKAKALNINCKHIELETHNIYKGYIEVVGTTDTINNFFETVNEDSLYPNEYVIIKDLSTDSEYELRWDGSKFVELIYPDSKIIKGMNQLQRCAIDLLMNKRIPVVAILGGYGSGKTFLCTQMASYFVVEKRDYKKILGIREPNGEGKDVGFLKGTFEDKTSRFFKPIEQQMKGEMQYETYIDKGILETEIPYYMKGTTYDNTIFVVDEAEDLSESQIRLIGTRVGKDSRIFFSGDFAQSLVNKTSSNPLVKMCEEFKGNKNFGCIYLDEDVRSDTSKMFANLFK